MSCLQLDEHKIRLKISVYQLLILSEKWKYLLYYNFHNEFVLVLIYSGHTSLFLSSVCGLWDYYIPQENNMPTCEGQINLQMLGTAFFFLNFLFYHDPC